MARNGSPLGRMLTVIDCPNSSLRFLILDCPTESTLDFYMEEFMRLNVVAVVRCCQPTYSATRLTDRNIQVLDLPFKDGGVVSSAGGSSIQRERERLTLEHSPRRRSCVSGYN